jgi:chromosomal replication initiator protein
MCNLELENLWHQIYIKGERYFSSGFCDIFLTDLEPISLKPPIFTIGARCSAIYMRKYNHYIKIIETLVNELINSQEHISVKVVSTDLEVTKRQYPIDQICAKSLPINHECTFESFIIYQANRIAYKAANSLVDSSGDIINYIFLYGSMGVGKTHLLNAIANSAMASTNNKKVLYTSAEQFVDEYLYFKREQCGSFYTKYNDIDILIVDDIEGLYADRDAQREFFLLFNKLYDSKKQIVISSYYAPDELFRLDDNLRCCLKSGFITDIQKPDYNARIAILENIVAINGLVIPQKILEYIAQHIDNNIKRLIEAPMRALDYASYNKLNLSLDIMPGAINYIYSQS